MLSRACERTSVTINFSFKSVNKISSDLLLKTLINCKIFRKLLKTS